MQVAADPRREEAPLGNGCGDQPMLGWWGGLENWLEEWEIATVEDLESVLLGSEVVIVNGLSLGLVAGFARICVKKCA